MTKTNQQAVRAFRAAFKCYDRAAERAGMTYIDRATALLPSNHLVIRFTDAEIRRMERAARISGHKRPADCPTSCGCHIPYFARSLVLQSVDGILKKRAIS